MNKETKITMNERVLQAIFKAVDEVNQILPKEQQLEKSMDTVVLDNIGSLDSLGLVNLIVAIEQKIEDEFGVTIIMTDERIMLRNDRSVKTIGTLAADISLVLSEKTNG